MSKYLPATRDEWFITITVSGPDEDDVISEADNAVKFIAERDGGNVTTSSTEVDVRQVEDPLVESPSGWDYRASQENGDNVDCVFCGNPLNDDQPILNDTYGYAYHPECLKEA